MHFDTKLVVRTPKPLIRTLGVVGSAAGSEAATHNQATKQPSRLAMAGWPWQAGWQAQVRWENREQGKPQGKREGRAEENKKGHDRTKRTGKGRKEN